MSISMKLLFLLNILFSRMLLHTISAVLVVAAFLLSATGANAEEDEPETSSIIPGHVRAVVHTSGYMGNIGVGLQYHPSSWMRTTLSYGKTQLVNGGTFLEQYNLTHVFHLFDHHVSPKKRFKWKPFHLGLGLVWSPDQKFFVRSPNKYPASNYYEPTAIHYMVVMGTELEWRNRWAFFAAFHILDQTLAAYLNDTSWRPEELASVSLGASFSFLVSLSRVYAKCKEF